MNAVDLAKVPAFPPVATKLLQVASDERSGSADLVHLLRSDPTLSAEIIQRANSPLFNLRVEVHGLEQAVPLLGARRIRILALSAINRTYLRATLMEEELHAFWRYSVACAQVAERLARGTEIPEDVAYAAAMLHDIGRLGLMVTYPVEYPRLLQTAAEELQAGNDFDLLEYEHSLLGTDRYEAGEWLARQWNLPQELQAAAGRYDVFVEESNPGLIGLVLAACRIANSLGFHILADPRRPSYEELLETLPHRLRSHLPARAADLCAQIEKEIGSLDSDVCTAEPELAAQTLLNLGDLNLLGHSAKDEIPTETAHRPLWPLILAGAVAFLTGLTILKFALGL